MADVRFLVLCFVLVQIFLIQSTAIRTLQDSPEPQLENIHTIAEPPSSILEDSPSHGEGPVAATATDRRINKHQSSDKSVACGGVILGGLFTALFFAVYSYLRVTRRQSNGDKI